MTEKQLTVEDTIVAILGLSLGGWLVFDGTIKLATGVYIGEDTIGIGPWARLCRCSE